MRGWAGRSARGLVSSTSRDEVVEDYGSALKVWLTFVRLMLELHDEWDDHDADETERRAAAAELKGRAWVSGG